MPRRPPPDIEPLLAAMSDDASPSSQAAGAPEAVVDAIRHGPLDAVFGLPSLADWLCSDIGGLAAAFADAIGVAFVGVQFAPSIADRERRCDDVGLGHRLVTAYRETGMVPPHVLVFCRRGGRCRRPSDSMLRG